MGQTRTPDQSRGQASAAHEMAGSRTNPPYRTTGLRVKRLDADNGVGSADLGLRRDLSESPCGSPA